MQHYFINNNQINLETGIVVIKDGDAHHITNVMRMRKNDHVVVCNNENFYEVRLDNISQNECLATIIKKLDIDSELKVEVTIAQGMVKLTKQEEVIEKITQLGAATYISVDMERSNVKNSSEKLEKKLQRLEKIVKEASEQSHRAKLLKVMGHTTFAEFINLSKDYDLKVVLNLTNSGENKETINKIKQTMNKKVLFLIGPEGGISDSECETLKKAGFYTLTVGPRVLRTEVAPLYVMSMMGVFFDLEE